jgi:hypothetical protein
MMRPMYWTSLFLKVIEAARNSVSRAGQSNPSPMNELVPTEQQRRGIGGVVGELFGDLTALPGLHLPAQYDDGLTGGAESFRKSVEMVDPRGEYEDVGTVAVSAQDVGQDLLEPGFIGNEGSVDLGYSAWGARIGLPCVAELGGV